MSKVSVIGIFSHPGGWSTFHGLFPLACPRGCVTKCVATWFAAACCVLLAGQTNCDAQEATDFQYPIAVTAEPSDTDASTADLAILYVVDLELPGVWKVTADGKQVFARGAKQFRQPLNRPRCIAIHPDGGVLVGDSATRDIYWLESAGADPKPLTGGKIGIPMAVAVSPDGQQVYVADAETMAILRFPITGLPDGGDRPVWVARVNARGIGFFDATKLVAVTPDKQAVRQIDVSGDPVARPNKIVDDPTVSTLVDDRPFAYPNGLAVAGGNVWIADGYGDAIFKVDGDGSVTKWFEGDPLAGPVGVAVSGSTLWVADPQARQIIGLEGDDRGKVVATRE